MKRLAIWTVLGLLSGAFIGSFTGVAALGSAWNGAWIFGPIGAAIGFLFALKLPDRKRN